MVLMTNCCDVYKQYYVNKYTKIASIIISMATGVAVEDLSRHGILIPLNRCSYPLDFFKSRNPLLKFRVLF